MENSKHKTNYTQKPGSGALFVNTKRTSALQPDVTGTITMPDGKSWRLAGWTKHGSTGKFLSLAVSEMVKPEGQPQAVINAVQNQSDGLPF